jgi:hypothetical protein
MFRTNYSLPRCLRHRRHHRAPLSMPVAVVVAVATELYDRRGGGEVAIDAIVTVAVTIVVVVVVLAITIAAIVTVNLHQSCCLCHRRCHCRHCCHCLISLVWRQGLAAII